MHELNETVLEHNIRGIRGGAYDWNNSMPVDDRYNDFYVWTSSGTWASAWRTSRASASRCRPPPSPAWPTQRCCSRSRSSEPSLSRSPPSKVLQRTASQVPAADVVASGQAVRRPDGTLPAAGR